MSSAAQSMAPAPADAAADSRVVNGLCVKSRRNDTDAEDVLASSAFAVMAAIVATALAGKAPFAVSPESIVASAPSNTAFATSVISARVGRGLPHIDSSICVAQMTKRPATLALVMSIFCASADLLEGISMPRSPRATMMPSEYLRMSSMLATPSSFSIFEMICTFCPPASSRMLRMSCTSSPLHEGRGDEVHLVLAAKVLHVVDVLLRQHGDVNLHAGQVAVLALAELLAVQHGALQHGVGHDAVTLMEMEPSAMRMLFPGFTDWHSLA